MWIKNLCVFTSADAFAFSAKELEQTLKDNPCPPCGQQSASSEGFVPPLKDQGQMLYAVGDFLYGMYQETVRLLPSSVIKEELLERVEQIQAEQDRKVGRKEKADLKEQITFELLPKAFTRSRQTAFIVDTRAHQVWVDASSANRAEQVISALRKALGSLSVSYLGANSAPATSFSQWLLDPTTLPNNVTLGDRCELQGTKTSATKVRFTAVDLSREDILAHLQGDMQAIKLNLCWHDELEFDLTESLDIKRIRPLDVFQENLDALDADDAVDELQARIALQGGVLQQLLGCLADYFQSQNAEQAA